MKILKIIVVVCLMSMSVNAYAARRTSAYKDGLKYLKAHAYTQAVEKLSQALTENYGKSAKKKIQKSLDQAKKAAAKQCFEKGVQLSLKNEINGALMNFEKAYEFHPENTTYEARYKQEKEKYNKIATKIENILKETNQTKNWDKGLKELEKMRIYEAVFPSIDQKVNQLKKQAANHHLDKSEENLVLQDFKGAYDEIVKAIVFSDSKDMQNKKKARQSFLFAQQAYKKENYRKAYEETQKGLQFEPKNEELLKYDKKLTNEWMDVLYNEAVVASNDGKYGIAKSRLMTISRIKPGYLDVTELLEELKETLAAIYYAKAEELFSVEDRSQMGTVLVSYLLVKDQYLDEYPDINDKIKEAKKLLKKEIEYRISLDFKNESAEPGAAGYVKDQVLDRLNNADGLKNLKILEREAIDEILREQGLGQGFLDETTNLQVKKIKGIQAGIKGSVIKVDVKESGRDRPTYGSARYKSGTKHVPNMKYQQVQMEVSKYQQEVLMAQQAYNNAQLASAQTPQGGTGVGGLAAAFTNLGNALETTGAQNSLKAAQKKMQEVQQQLSNTPMQLEEDVMSDFRYEIFNLKLEGEVVITFRLINFTTSEIGRVRTIRKYNTVTDRYIPGDPGKGVYNDPNNLPTIDDFKRRLLSMAIEDTVYALKEELGGYSYHFYKKGLQAEEDGFQEDAIENYVRFIYSAPNLKDKRVEHANEYIYDNLGLMILRRKK